ncbi:flagellar basal-body rod protein FlgF [Acidithiobacillus thiooxidans]|jgi:flagellar basal-body rod protein FlgF|uniref:Flagellar basal-body rod protein FlgF n=3 Tax=Acidithiobacillus thiooxidans TaxID=930 RepID=A0A1C2IW81_ACITH|nr:MULTISPECIES: flagellar basal-body rod protein FlgF [Acidithiobacillus]MBE7565548.1 flagellar basal-body rod protein FlgF [Acidithiobacillus sp. HP-11]MBU2749484.1 flagellar basal-body rod protein FlgF [Acidithiobacillus thiooxidans]MBU2794928.1 flagellar basal-body rod protein FlgF [Acidithiobacillus thiooxidans]MBU2810501.1 flagellar basal-body rod protein FlgF [Acidithiobacillus thiooxidans]MBU2838405.1 flagellar basal-body rod protein FlgF [Acidithiobacillus thiooxidans]
MDTLYIAMSGANAILQKQTVTANNLANANTTGYRADEAQFSALPVYGQGLPTRAYTATETPSVNFQSGPVVRTGRPLDVAVNGQGWLTVQGPDGKEAYTRDGNLQLNGQGILMTATGHPVLGVNGSPISLPPMQSLVIGSDGVISGVPVGSQPNAVVTINQIKLVNPSEKGLQKNPDGLFQNSDGKPAAEDGNVVLEPGALEGSNVNPVNAMIQMLEDTRQFDMQTKLMQTISQDRQSANQLLVLS